MTPDRDALVWVDGAVVPASQAAVSPFDHGVTVGDGVFETAKVVTDADGVRQAFALGRHLARLRRSAAGLGLDVPVDDETLRRAVRALLDANPDDGRLRITVTGGHGPLGSGRGEGPPTVLVASAPVPAWGGSAAVVTVPWRRNEHSPVAGLKTTSYAENVVALRAAHDAGADEAIFANTAGMLCEGTGSNIFVVHEGELVTPPLSAGCLAGIVRELVLEVAGATERDLPIEVLADVTEAFLTSSTRDVQPIDTIDGRALAPVPGARTADAAAALAALEAADVDP